MNGSIIIRQPRLSGLAALLFALYATPTLAADIANGQRLHDERCTACHIKQVGGDGSKIYLRSDHKIRSPKALEQQVAACNHMNQSGFSPAEEKDVIAYLAQHFYKFKP